VLIDLGKKKGQKNEEKSDISYTTKLSGEWSLLRPRGYNGLPEYRGFRFKESSDDDSTPSAPWNPPLSSPFP